VWAWFFLGLIRVEEAWGYFDWNFSKNQFLSTNFFLFGYDLRMAFLLFFDF